MKFISDLTTNIRSTLRFDDRSTRNEESPRLDATPDTIVVQTAHDQTLEELEAAEK